MCDLPIPNDYTPCECYRGHVIALRHGRYEVFCPPNGAMKVGLTSGSRAEARKQIDWDHKHGL